MAMKLLGRYDVIDELGRGDQSIVYLARDSRMSRQVVVKRVGDGSSALSEDILREARVASNLNHPNVIPIYDLGASEGYACLVYSYIAGESLDQALKKSGPMPVSNAIRIVADVLDALASAHGQGIVHYDIKPSNIMIASSGQNLVTDFAIDRAILQSANKTNAGKNFPPYVAPEIVNAQGGEIRSDIYSVAVMLCEMVTGSPLIGGEEAKEDGVAQSKLDDKLKSILQKASALKPEVRYSSALEFRQALMDYLEDSKEAEVTASDSDVASTLKFLLRRIRNKSDFPAMSGVINEIDQIAESDTEEANKLSQIILQDFALTNKLLKLVNTVSYSQFGGKINTISKAVSILGFGTVRNIAKSLVLMDFIQSKSQAQELKDSVTTSFFSGVVAVQLSEWKSAQEVEEAMICSMFFNLGRMLTKFYFFDESAEIAKLVETKGMDEEKAAQEVLGISYNELGIGIAKSWNFPDTLISGMQRIKAEQRIEPSEGIGRLNVAVNMANELCAVASVSDPKAKSEELRKISERYSAVTDASIEKISTALERGLQDLSSRSKAMGIDTAKSPLIKKLQVWLAEPVEVVDANGDSQIIVPGYTGDGGASRASAEELSSREAMLHDGLQEVINTMQGEYKLNEVLQMILETIYRGLGFSHVFVFSRDVKKNMMVARFGFGANVVDYLPRFHFSLVFEADVFHLALAKGLDIVIEDVGAPNIANKIPAWHSKAIDSRYFLLLPMVINNVSIGLIYADMLEAKKLKISTKEMTLLHDLRDQAVKAIQQHT